MAPKISKTSKMKITGKKVGSWSLPAGTSCPGAKGAEVCEGCYAKKGMYRFPVVKNVREHNAQDYHRDDWVADMIKEVSKYDYFRWFDSGDIETPELARKISQVTNNTRTTKHWLPTRSDKITKIAEELNGYSPAMLYTGNGTSQPLPYSETLRHSTNVALRPSADNIGLNNNERPGVNSYVIRDTDLFEAKRQGIFVCPVTTDKNRTSCDTCTMCYTNAKVAYLVH